MNARPIFISVLLVGSALAVGDQRDPSQNQFSIDMQVQRNTARIEALERELHELQDWRQAYLEKTTLPGFQRLTAIETTVATHEWMFRGIGILILGGIITSVMRLILKRQRNG